MSADGVLWASDPDWRNNGGRIIRIGTDGTHTVAATDIRVPNGIEVAPDERTLYVGEGRDDIILAFDITGNTLTNRREHAVLMDMGRPDGMRCDAEGWLYVAMTGTSGNDGSLAVVDPGGTVTGSIPIGGSLRNIAFGGSGGRTAFIAKQYTVGGTRTGGFATVQMERPGRSWGLFGGTTYVTGATHPDACAITGNFPNPFNPRTGITFTLSTDTRARLDIFNIAGQRVRTLLDRDMSAGNHRAEWDGRDDRGAAVSSGVYIVRLIAGVSQVTHRMTLLR